MCTKSVVRFRLSLKDNNCETLEKINLNLNDKTINTIENQSKYLSTICSSIRQTIGLKANNSLITENINMNKGLQNGHQLNENSISDNKLDIISINTTVNTTTTTSSSSTSTPLVNNSCESTMGLLNALPKDTHQLLSTLKSGKPENGQRLNLNTISWSDLKQQTNVNNKLMDEAIHLPQTDVISDTNQTDNIPQNSLINDQIVDQMIDEELSKSEPHISDGVNSDALLENNASEEQHTELLLTPQTVDFNKEILNEVSDSGTVLPNVEVKITDFKDEQMSLIRHSERLLRRIRRLQFRQTHNYMTQQMKSFVKNQQMILGVGCQRQPSESNPISVMKFQSNASQVEDRMKLLTPEVTKGLSTSALVNLVKRLESTNTPNETNHLHDFCPQTPIRAPLQTSSLSSTSQSSNLVPQTNQMTTTCSQHIPNTNNESSLVKLLQRTQSTTPSQTSSQSHPTRISAEDKEQILNTIDSFSANLRHFETGYDSDATESSSGGESCDEFEDYSDESTSSQHSAPTQSSGHVFPIRKRSCWKWCVERAAIASRWTWLQAQVADLEFRIRQQNEMYRQLRATKGVISFGTGDHKLTVPTNLVTKANITTTTPTTSTAQLSQTSTQSQSVNATPKVLDVSDTVPKTGQNDQLVSNSTDSDNHCCMRTLPLNSMRKRKLVHSMSALSGATRKAAKYSTILCSCNGLPDIMWPCVLCNGRYSYVHVIDTDCMPHFERVSLLDSSCHPVLSLNNDVSLGLHLTELLKRETIQRPIPSRHLNKKRSQKSPPSPTVTNKFFYDSSKNKSPKRSQSVISSTKLKRKYGDRAKRRYVRRSGVSSDEFWRNNNNNKRGRPRERTSSGSSRTESPIPSPVPSEGSTSCTSHPTSAPLHRRRRSEQHAFDINNIVIPYSIAATTRVEKLQYKEIITPKWRKTEDPETNFNFLSLKTKTETNTAKETKTVTNQLSTNDDEEEDMSDIAFNLRHIKCEEEERKRILSYIKGNKSGNLRRGRVRFDSTRSDTKESTGGGDNVFNNESMSQDSVNGPPTPVVINHNNIDLNNSDYQPPERTERRRNASLSSRRDDSIDENVETVVPFDLRTFPLNDLEIEKLTKEDASYLCPLDNTLDDSINDPEKSNEGTITANNSRAPTPVDSDGAESVTGNNDEMDDEDPEWEPKK
ncbi:KAT8 regulatory NSL complex subunit 1-like [Oppia nitens]|uniref:KAT8 regulatory NSL complex subunit 1-like n=1 Tax=Oppia nitens TaxID=1686743 RepID=UPI0023D98B38|nr:KAT8 regulatory NSL complex subunit 1-like [Oppia nitens]